MSPHHNNTCVRADDAITLKSGKRFRHEYRQHLGTLNPQKISRFA